MKKTAFLFLLLLLSTLVVDDVVGQANEIRHCVTTDGKLRAFVQHFRDDTTPTTSDTLTLRDDTTGYGSKSFTVQPTGWVNNVLNVNHGLPGCASTVSDVVKSCQNYNQVTTKDTGCNDGKNDPKLEFFDRHVINCDDKKALTSWWMLNTCNGGTSNNFKFRYRCDAIPEATGNRILRKTACDTAYGHSLEFLDRFNVQCGTNEVMTGWSMKRFSCSNPEHMQIQYYCVPVSSGGSCSTYKTNCNPIVNQNNIFLDRHPITCPSHQPWLKGYRQTPSGCGGNEQRYEYTCCSLNSSPPTDWVWYDFDAVHVLEGGAIGGDYTLLSGNNMVHEGCPELLPTAMSQYNGAPDPATTQKIKDKAWEKTRLETIAKWTPHMMAKAVPLELYTLSDPFRTTGHRQLFGNKALQKAEENKMKKMSTIGDSRWVSDARRKDVNGTGAGEAMADASGRLIFMFGNKPCSCSASAVRDYNSPDRSLIVTAAHCIYDEKQKIFASHILFIPGIDQGGFSVSKRDCSDYEYGCWIPEFAVVDSEWASNLNDVVHDFGFLVVKNKGAHVGRGGRNLALEDTVQTVDLDWNNKADVEVGDTVYTMGLPGTWSAELRYARGSLKQKHGLHFTYGCNLVEGASGGPMPLDPFDENPKLFSVNSFKSGYWEGNIFVQTACGGPVITGNSFCALLQASEEAEFGSPESVVDGGLIHPYEPDAGCVLPGWCEVDAECDDGLYCNGEEVCVDNHCTAGTDPCDGYRCDEESRECLPPCTSDAQCDDGIFCNGVEKCMLGKCVAGPGNPCAADEMCNPITDKCVEAECTQASDCITSGLFCQGKGLCMDGQCHVIDTCEPDEICDELSRTCSPLECALLEEQDFCLEDDDNECCICLDYCGHQEKEVIECAPFLFFPWPFPWPEKEEKFLDEDLEARYLRLLDEDGNNMTILGDFTGNSPVTVNLNGTETGNETKAVILEPTCLMWSLFMDGIWGEKPKTLLN